MSIINMPQARATPFAMSPRSTALQLVSPRPESGRLTTAYKTIKYDQRTQPCKPAIFHLGSGERKKILSLQRATCRTK